MLLDLYDCPCGFDVSGKLAYSCQLTAVGFFPNSAACECFFLIKSFCFAFIEKMFNLFIIFCVINYVFLLN